LLLVLRVGTREVKAVGLVDSGATVNVLPFELSVQLGTVWDKRKEILRVSESLGGQSAMPIFAQGEIEGLRSARLALAWIRPSGVPLILGRTKFFMQFDARFYRSKLEFEIRSRSPA
jgi:hypothetical protein